MTPRICPKCHQENEPEIDFCTNCGEYLRWEATGYLPAVRADPPSPAPAEPAAPPPEAPSGAAQPSAAQPPAPRVVEAPPPTPIAPQVPARPDDVIVTARLPGQETAGAEHVRLPVDPGGRAVFKANVRNQSGVVDNYDLRVEGVPAEWVTVTPATLYLVPFGAPGGIYEQEVEVLVHPPRSAEAEARDWPLRVVARSRAQEADAGGTDGTMTVAPYTDFETTLGPEIRAGRRRASYAVDVRNRANAPLQVALAGKDQEQACAFRFEKPLLEVAPGRRESTALQVYPPKQIIVGRSKDRRLEVVPTQLGRDDPVVPRQAVFRQRPWIPFWVPPLLLLLLAAVVAFIATRPKAKPVALVPDVRAAIAKNPGVDQLIAAQQTLDASGLTMQTKNVNAKQRADVGKVVAQVPLPGLERKPGDPVTLFIGVGKERRRVPLLAGLTLRAASAKLRDTSLQVGQINRNDIKLAQAKVLDSNPTVGTLIPIGSKVDLIYDLPPPAASTAASTPSGGSGAAKAAQAAIPKVAGKSLDETLSQLRQLGLGAVPLAVISTVAKGSVLSTDPAAGAPADPAKALRVLYSAGFPRVAYTLLTKQGPKIVVAGGARGASPQIVSPKTLNAQDPAWSADGRLAFSGYGANTAQRRIYVDGAGAVPPTRAASDAGHDDQHPVFSPDGRLIAFIRKHKVGATEDGDLCIVSVDALGSPSCASDSKTYVDLPVWPKPGMILVVSRPTAIASGQSELVVYRNQSPDKSTAAAWKRGLVLTAPLHAPGPFAVEDAAVSPGGRVIAIVATWNASDPSKTSAVLYALDSVGRPTGNPLSAQIPACTVDFRKPDGAELVVGAPTQGCHDANGYLPTRLLRHDLKTGQEQPLDTAGDALQPAWGPLP